MSLCMVSFISLGCVFHVFADLHSDVATGLSGARVKASQKDYIA